MQTFIIPPRNFHVKEFNENRLWVGWLEPDQSADKIDSYEITYQALGPQLVYSKHHQSCTQPNYHKIQLESAAFISANATDFDILCLNPITQYRITLRAKMTKFSVVDEEFEVYFSKPIEILEYTQIPVPDNLIIENGHANVAKIRWDKIVVPDYNLRMKYEVSFQCGIRAVKRHRWKGC